MTIFQGSSVHFHSVSLPAAQSIVLRPHNDLWRPLNHSDNGVRLLSGKENEGKNLFSLLSFFIFSDQLSRLSVLFVGQTIEIETFDGKSAMFDVLEINPSESGAVIARKKKKSVIFYIFFLLGFSSSC